MDIVHERSLEAICEKRGVAMTFVRMSTRLLADSTYGTVTQPAVTASWTKK